MKPEFSSYIFGKILEYQISWKSVQWEPSCNLRTEGQGTAKHDKTNCRLPKFFEHTSKVSLRPFYQYEAGYSTGHSSTLPAPRQEEKKSPSFSNFDIRFPSGVNEVSLLRDATQRRSPVSYRRFGSTYRSHF